MADENQELRHINWTELFSFTQIFKGFKLAIHPSKMILALGAIVLVLLVGALMDFLWFKAGQGARVNDVYRYYAATGEADYDRLVKSELARNQGELVRWYMNSERDVQTAEPVAGLLQGDSAFLTEFRSKARQAPRAAATPEIEIRKQAQESMRDLWKRYRRNVRTMLRNAEDYGENAEGVARDKMSSLGPAERETARKRLRSDKAALDRAILVIRREYLDDRERALFGIGVGNALWQYEHECFGNAVWSVWRGNLFGGFDRLVHDRTQAAVAFGEIPRVSGLTGAPSPAESMASLGFFPWVLLMLWGLLWLALTHTLYAIIFLLAALAIWALLGGAIARIAALHAAREEKISIPQAVRFSLGKFFSFFTAPLIPLAIILVLGLLMGLVGLGLIVPGLNIILALLAGLGLIVGAVIAFLTLGLVAGSPLMYPTIAVEGSDSFDAISRSFSYVFSRPWRYGLYTIVAAVYGTVCYLFVRLFAFLLLAATRLFVGHGLFGYGLSSGSGSQMGEGASKLDVLWAPPTFDSLARGINFPAMSIWERVPALFINLWVYLVAALVLAFALSYFVSAYTTIYYLLRRKVDATDLDDVYVEEPEGEEEIPTAAPAAGSTAITPAAPPTTPPVEPPGAEPPVAPQQ